MKKNTLAAVHVVSDILNAANLELHAETFTPTVVAHLSTGIYHGAILIDNSLCALSAPLGLYEQAFAELRRMVKATYVKLADTLPADTHIVAAPDVPPLNFDDIKMNRISPETMRKTLVMQVSAVSDQMQRAGARPHPVARSEANSGLSNNAHVRRWHDLYGVEAPDRQHRAVSGSNRDRGRQGRSRLRR